jgi:Bacterial protein of unknown function (Gcw_chp)
MRLAGGRLADSTRVVLAVAMVVSLRGLPAWAQAASDPNPGNLTITGGIDFLNAYIFRGIPQDDTGVVMWPYGDLGISLHSGAGIFKSIGVNVGLWNSLHTGNAGLDGPSEKLWYESDFYATFGLGFGAGTSLGVTYTAYTSPNGLFNTVRELSFKFAIDDSGALGRAATKPYVLVARELEGQADGGAEEGTYLEVGAAPGLPVGGWTVNVPLRAGFSLGDYYEGVLGDERFGFFSVAGIVTIPLTSMPTKVGSWNIHGGVEYVRLGDRNAEILGDTSKVIGSIGIGLSY